ncbi:hypothetical protein GW17_00033242 [Ensete ventricosum]|nr:hypothetical protein GW17_00033242 [Ensete ventricosum]RZS10928.1 hypothetical protein BHM03_00042205 [Ensete ventricosum]
MAGSTRRSPRKMDSHSKTSEEATSARGTRSAVDLVSEVELHVLHTSRPYPEGRQRVIIPETARGTNRSTLRMRTTEGASIHAGSLDPHRRW